MRQLGFDPTAADLGGAAGIASSTHAATSKSTPVDADELPIVDSAASWGIKKLTWANLKATLLTWLRGTVFPDPGPIGSVTPSTGSFTSIGIGAPTVTEYNLFNAKDLTGAVTAYGEAITGTVRPDVTSSAFYSITLSSTAAASFTLSNLYHYCAVQGTFGAGSVVTNQFAFSTVSTLIGATNNYGFYSDIAAGANRYNFYVAGTADNYFAGQLYTSTNVLAAGSISARVNTAIPAGGTAGAGFKLSSTADFGVFFGSGAPTLSAAKGSLYLRSDGSGTNNRMYVNTNGATTWTAVITAA